MLTFKFCRDCDLELHVISELILVVVSSTSHHSRVFREISVGMGTIADMRRDVLSFDLVGIGTSTLGSTFLSCIRSTCIVSSSDTYNTIENVLCCTNWTQSIGLAIETT